MPTDQQILSEEQIVEIEKHDEISIDSKFASSQIPALCQTVRALRQALRDHGEHESHCTSNERYPSPKCDCVLAQYLDHQGD